MVNELDRAAVYCKCFLGAVIVISYHSESC